MIASQRQYIQQLEIQLVRLHDKFVHVVQQLAHNEHSQLHALLPQLRNWRRSGAGRAQQQPQSQSHRLQLGGSEEQSGNGASNDLQVELALADLQFSSDQPQEININDPVRHPICVLWCVVWCGVVWYVVVCVWFFCVACVVVVCVTFCVACVICMCDMCVMLKMCVMLCM